VLTKIFGPNEGDVTGNWRRLHNDEFHDLYSSSNISFITTVTWTGLVTCMRGKEILKGFGGAKPEGRRPLAKARSRWREH
jgi:hypothetical protein